MRSQLVLDLAYNSFLSINQSINQSISWSTLFCFEHRASVRVYVIQWIHLKQKEEVKQECFGWDNHCACNHCWLIKNVRKEQELRKIEGDVRNNSHDESVLCFENKLLPTDFWHDAFSFILTTFHLLIAIGSLGKKWWKKRIATALDLFSSKIRIHSYTQRFPHLPSPHYFFFLVHMTEPLLRPNLWSIKNMLRYT